MEKVNKDAGQKAKLSELWKALQYSGLQEHPQIFATDFLTNRKSKTLESGQEVPLYQIWIAKALDDGSWRVHLAQDVELSARGIREVGAFHEGRDITDENQARAALTMAAVFHQDAFGDDNIPLENILPSAAGIKR